VDDAEIMSDALWALAHISDTSNESMLTMLGRNSQLIIILVQQLSEDDSKVKVPALRCIGNLLTAEDNDVIETLLFHGVLDKFEDLLIETNVNIIKETLWSLSNIMASRSDFIETLF
jgi:hypothetical protein